MDHYLSDWRSCLAKLKAVHYFVADGFYPKIKVFNAFEQAGKYLITKLRSDADLRYRYQGQYPPGQGGRKRQYDGKVDYTDLRRWQFVGPDQKYAHLHLYPHLLN